MLLTALRYRQEICGAEFAANTGTKLSYISERLRKSSGEVVRWFFPILACNYNLPNQI